MTQRVYTRLGKSLGKDKRLPGEKVDEVASVVERQVRHARELGAERVRVVATAAIRQAANRDELVSAIERSAGVETHVLSDDDEARLAFAGATRMLSAPADGAIAVVDVGGGSTEIAIGTLLDGVTWSRSFRIGSGYLADSYLRSDPPAATELDAARHHAEGVFEGLRTPAVERAVACGGSAGVAAPHGRCRAHARRARARRPAPGERTARRDRRALRARPRARAPPARGGPDPRRGLGALGTPLKIGGGGLREGVVLELAAAH